jgi:Flp pilus assembly protein TadG
MRRSRTRGSDGGSASLEFITVALVLLVPLIYLVLALSSLQAGSLAVEGAARQAARVYVSSGEKDAERAIAVSLADYGLKPASIRVSCAPDPHDCDAEHALVTVEVAARVGLPLMPPIIADGLPTGVLVSSSATQQVSRFEAAR